MDTRVRYFINGKVSLYRGKLTVAKAQVQDLRQPSVYVSHLSVPAKWQNKGYGADLMMKLIIRFTSLKYEALSLHYAISNVNALRFYKRLGFFIVATREHSEGEPHYLLTIKL